MTKYETEALADAIVERLAKKFQPLFFFAARLAAADTRHTVEKPDAVFRHAIKEGEIAWKEFTRFIDAKAANKRAGTEKSTNQ